MGQLLLIDGLCAVAVLATWYFCFARYNRKKGTGALRLVEAACSGQGRITDARWFGANRLQARLRLAGHWVEDARVTVNLRPRPIPVQWLLSIWRKQPETLTFEANLDYSPGLQLQVFRHRWLTPNKTTMEDSSRDWTIVQPGPVVLTTRMQWGQEIAPIVNTLMSSPGHELLRVRFRSESPHLSATVALESLSDEEASASFLEVVHDLAVRASTSPQ
ncbi:MAG TPA: hypothetical protein VMH85_16325 [Terriglobales bacterium]|nr:hypothetical protein [Terriglobales bacterium]